ncbi:MULTISPECIES: virB8 family protein [unclassified Sulfitobacter]|uniref:virB8 family protein n=1 Tax=unclassified Sulfitobacter TaxID=196795 RepID=UPI0037477D62
MNDDPKTILEAEVIYGAMRRERFWQIGFGAMALSAVIATVASALVLTSVRPPAPIVVPFDPTTGNVVPNASVEAVSLDERKAVIQAQVFQYVQDRETYNQIDNDIRINRALAKSTGTARKGLVRLWDSGSEDFLPDRYGNKTQVKVVITSISILDTGRVQVRMRKRLDSPDGSTLGNFTAVVGYEFQPGEERTLEAVWKNPLGFSVTEYEIYADRGS